MNRRSKVLLAVLCAAVAVSLLAILLGGRSGEGPPVAVISLDGEILKEIRLDTVDAPYSFELQDGAGGINTVEVEPGRIRISGANCPDQVCVDQGFIRDGTVPIVCLPHRLMIEIKGGGGGLDAAAG